MSAPLPQGPEKARAVRGLFDTIAGRYEDELVRSTDGWRISHRSLIEMWTAGDPHPTGRN